MTTLGTTFIDDGVSVEVAPGVVAQESATQVQAQFSGKTITPTANFSFMWNGMALSYIAGESTVVTADQLAAFTAAGAPFTQP